MTKDKSVTSPRDVKIDLNVRATHAAPTGERVPLAPRISVVPRPDGMTIHVDWKHVASPARAASTVNAPHDLQDEIDSVEQAQQWLDQKLRAWTGRG